MHHNRDNCLWQEFLRAAIPATIIISADHFSARYAERDPKSFAKFFIEGGTLAWPNGVDIAPESLYVAADIRLDNKRKNNRRARQAVRPPAK